MFIKEFKTAEIIGSLKMHPIKPIVFKKNSKKKHLQMKYSVCPVNQ